jgi:hypothetical protein
MIVTDYIAEHGKPPMLGDAIPPWRYRGWLLWYVQRVQESHPAVPDRWSYLHYIHETGRLPKAPIPQLHFGDRDQVVFRDLEKAINIAGEWGRLGYGWTALRALIQWLAWGLGIPGEKESDLDDAVQEKLYRFVNIGPWLLSPYDYLGSYIAETRGKGSWNPNAFYPTPHSVCEMMVSMLLADAGDIRTRSVMDPCVGTGRFLMHASNHSLFLFGQDIDPLMCLITKINGALYAPWMLVSPPDHLLSGKPAITLPPIPPPPGKVQKLPPVPPPPSTIPLTRAS